MKLVWVGIGLLVGLITVGVACGPKGKYCYQDMEPCDIKAGEVRMDALWEAAPPDADAEITCIGTNGQTIPCSG